MKAIIDPIKIIHKYYLHRPVAEKILLDHSNLVMLKAVKIAHYLQKQDIAVDIKFVAEAAMLHDIGMIKTASPDLGCDGDVPYLMHGLRGKEILGQEGLPRHARVCERHIGVGLTGVEIEQQKLPLPIRDVIPETIEEQIICYADLFFSKNPKNLNHEKTPDEVRATLKRYGKDKLEIFNRWLNMFEPEQ